MNKKFDEVNPPISEMPQRAVAPTKSTASRDAVAAIVDGVIAEASKSIASLTHSLEAVESVMLENAAHIKGELQEHVDLSIRILQETERVNEIVTQLQKQQERRLRRNGE